MKTSKPSNDDELFKADKWLYWSTQIVIWSMCILLLYMYFFD